MSRSGDTGTDPDPHTAAATTPADQRMVRRLDPALAFDRPRVRANQAADPDSGARRRQVGDDRVSAGDPCISIRESARWWYGPRRVQPRLGVVRAYIQRWMAAAMLAEVPVGESRRWNLPDCHHSHSRRGEGCRAVESPGVKEESQVA